MMNYSTPRKILYTLFFFTMTLTSGISRAEDTEIYFNSTADDVTIRPNVMLILDTSGSMGWDLAGGFGSPTRMEEMQDALTSILNSLEGVNIGLMRFNGDQGASVMFPIAYIDDPAANVVSEEDDTTISFSYNLDDSSSDAQELVSSGDITLVDTSINVPQIPETYATASVTEQIGGSTDDAYEYSGAVNSTSFVVALWNAGNLHQGLRFSGLNIPNGVTIDSATLDLYTYTINDSNTTSHEIYAEDVDDSAPFDSSNPVDISTRPLTDGTGGLAGQIDWNNIPAITGARVKTTSPDIGELVQEIINRPGWTSGNAMSLIIPQGTGTRRYYSFDGATGDTTIYPTLNVDYTYVDTPPQDQITAFHFTDIDIPQGAVITSATLSFASNSDAGGDGAEWIIQADDSDDSAAITGTNSDLSSRTATTAQAVWTVPDMVTSQTYSSCTDGSCVDESAGSITDISNVIQEVVDRAGWCGGNDMTFLVTGTGTRNIVTYEQSPSNSVSLSISYDAVAGGGCYRDSEISQVIDGDDDAEEATNGDVDVNESNINMSSRLVGLRFQDIQIPQNATILSATLSVSADICSWWSCNSQTSGSPTVTVKGELIGDSPAFSSNDDNISDRTTTNPSDNVDWNLGDFTVNDQWHDSPDISDIVEAIVSHADWAQGNALSLIISKDNQARTIESADGWSSSQAPILTIEFESTAGDSQVKTVREKLIELVNEMPADGITPIVESLYEAAHYWRGEDVVHGLSRGDASLGFWGGVNRTSTRISHPGSYCNDANDCNGADTANHPPYGIDEPAGCSLDDLDDSDCEDREIDGSPDYISPFSSDLTCVSNYQVLLTDGEATENDNADEISSEYLDGESCITTFSDDSDVDATESCGVDLAKYLFEEDQSALDNEQTVVTHTIGFTLSTQFLKDIATVGGGTFTEAGDQSDLIDTFTEILTDVRDDPTSFVSPSLATNAFNRLLSRDEVYFGLFTPSLDQSWDGNVKKYNICVSSGGPDEDTTTTDDNCTLGEILDANDDPAIDVTTNRFDEDAESEWTGFTDGLQTVVGGAGAQLDDYTTRTIYTDATSSPGVPPDSGTALDTTNGDGDSFMVDVDTWDDASTSHIRDLLCAVNSIDTGTADGQACQDNIYWTLGKIIDPDPDSDLSNAHWSFYDVLHSSPAVITYGGTDDDNDGLTETDEGEDDNDGVIDFFIDRIVVGTNEGGLRFIDGETGEEDWVFIPEELLNTMTGHYVNAEGDHLYGLDTTPTIRVVDVNSDGFIDPEYDNDGDGSYEAGDGEGDKVYVYVAMRRGGNSIYALDVTPATKLDDISEKNNTIVPKFLWRIDGGSGDFGRLADTWSPPRIATIGITSGSDVEELDVLIFGGGYDDTLDALDNGGSGPDYNFGLEGTTSGEANMGNAVYIVDADTGDLVLSISHDAGTAISGENIADGSDDDTSSPNDNIEVPQMFYSIPSRISILDTDGDGLDDRLYFGDTAGQVWRVDLATNINTAQNDTVVGRLATLSDYSDVADQRRFFDPPSVVQVKDTVYSDITDGEYDYVMIGSGNRAHPLDDNVHDRFYALRDKFVDGMPALSGNDNLADDTEYPQSDGPIVNTSDGNDLVDVTSQVLDSSNASHKSSMGWYLDFESMGNTGEKVLSAPTSIAGTVFFTTYQPVASSSDPCSANVGTGAAYNLGILSTKATVDWDDDTTLEDIEDRSMALGGGIPSDVVPVFTKEGVVGIVGIEGGAAQLGTLTGLPRYRTYWYQED